MHFIPKLVVSRRLEDARTRRARRLLIQNATHPSAGYVNSLVDWFELKCFWGTCPKEKKKQNKVDSNHQKRVIIGQIMDTIIRCKFFFLFIG